MIQVLRRTHLGLQDSLVPSHTEKLQRLVDKFEAAGSPRDEIFKLRSVNGFAKAALTMEWIAKRVEFNNEEFVPDQFDADVTLLNDKLFEAFLGEPFDVMASPHESPPAEVVEPEAEPSVARPEFEPAAAQPEPEPVEEPQMQPEPAPAISPATDEEGPGLTEMLDQNLLLGFQRFTEIVSSVAQKTPAERKTIFAVLGMIAKSSMDIARMQKKKDILDFFQSVVKFITYVDSQGSTQDARVAEVMKTVGERLSDALKGKSNGVALLRGINEILQDPQTVLNK